MLKNRFLARRRVVSLQLRSFAVGILLAMAAFYAIVLFHAPEAAAWVKSVAGTWYEASIYSALSIVAMWVLVGLAMIGVTGIKFLAIWGLAPRVDRWKVAKQTFFAVSMYLAFAILAGLAVVLLATHTRELIGSSYWARSQWFWQALLVILLLAFIALALHGEQLLTLEVLKDLRVLPVVSPLFCFAGPKFLLENFEKFGIPHSELRIHSALFVLSGVLFLSSLATQAFIRSEPGESSSSQFLLALDGTPLQKNTPRTSWLLYASFGLLAGGFTLFSLALINATMLLFA